MRGREKEREREIVQLSIRNCHYLIAEDEFGMDTTVLAETGCVSLV